MGETWRRWCDQLELAALPVSGGPRREVREKLLRESHASLLDHVDDLYDELAKAKRAADILRRET